MGTKLLKLSPIEVRGYRDPVAYFFGYDSANGNGNEAVSIFTLNADSDDLFSVWVVQWSTKTDGQDLHRTKLYVTSSYAMIMPIGETNPSHTYIAEKLWTPESNDSLCDTYVNPLFAGWKRQNIEYQLNMSSSVVGAEETAIHYVRGYIYRELPDRI